MLSTAGSVPSLQSSSNAISRRGVMANTREHRYSVSVTWSGNLGSGTSGYRDYSRNYEIGAGGKAVIHGSADPAFRGDRSRWNPEVLFVTSLPAPKTPFFPYTTRIRGIRAARTAPARRSS